MANDSSPKLAVFRTRVARVDGHRREALVGEPPEARETGGSLRSTPATPQSNLGLLNDRKASSGGPVGPVLQTMMPFFEDRPMRYKCLTTLLSLAMILLFSSGPQAAEPHRTSRWVGANYTPAGCVNAVQLWHEFPAEVIQRELAAAKEHFGITSLRVYLHNIPFDAEKDRFLQRIEEFLALCDRHGIKPGFVFFDDCWNHEGITLRSRPPVKGRHNGRWAACPQDVQRTEEKLPELKRYIQDVVRAHRRDGRVLWWEIYNEPRMKSDYSARLRKLGYRWAKEVGPIQPVICCWDDSPETDVVDAHNYGNNFSAWDRQADLNPRKGTVFTEAGARWFAPRRSNGEPIEVIDWLQRRKAAGKYVPGVYLCWELMVGNSNCRWYWGTKDGTPEPTIPWCGLMWPDCTPVSLAEAEAVRHYTTGRRRAMFFDDFQDAPAGRPTAAPGPAAAESWRLARA